jgi:SH3-like domain-containing protein
MNTKSSGIIPFIIVLLACSLFGEKTGEIIIIVPIIKLHTLPSADADIKSFADSGQRYTIDAESGDWYRILFKDGSNAWVVKEAVNVLRPYNTELVVTPAPPPRQAINVTAGHGAESTGGPNNGLTAAGYQSGAAAPPGESSAPVIAQTGKVAVPAQKASVTRTSSSPVPREAVDSQHTAASGTSIAPLVTASPIARLPAPVTDSAVEMHATAAAPLVTAPPAGVNSQGIGETIPQVSQNGATPEEVESALIRNGGRAMAPLQKRTWFSQFSHLGKTQSGTDMAFFQISAGRSAVYSLASTDANVLMIAEKGDFFPLLDEGKGTAWCKVALKDTTGWIERNKGIVVSTPSAGISEELNFIVIVLVSLALVAVLLLFLRHKARTRKRAQEKKIGEGSALEGDISESNLPEILQFIEMGKKNGCLQFEDTTPLGIIYFTQGRIVHAAAIDSITGREAVNYILGLQKGSFRFILDKQPKVSDLDLSTLEVLMERAKTEDEAHRH